MTKVDELIHILSRHDHAKAFTKAKSKRVCVICGQKALSFKTIMAQFEYNNSAICQSCQVEYLA
jgi:superfamily II helicase